MPTQVNVQITTVAVNLDEHKRPDGPAETISLRAAGKIAVLNGRPVLRYTEVPTEKDQPQTDVTVSKTDGGISVRRRGGAEVDFLFIPGKMTTSLYKIPPYSFDTSIETLKLSDEIGEGGGSLHLRYRMEIGGAMREVEMRLVAEAIV